MKDSVQQVQAMYAPFVKVDEGLRTVWGRATDETPDSDGEVVDYEATKRATGDWAKWRNVREMHEGKAAGVAEAITLDDQARALEIQVKVVDDAAWEKVKAGVYKGFSIGGKKLASVVEKAASGQAVTRITDYLLTEISLVDRPANPSAVFSLVKRTTEGDEKPENTEGGSTEEADGTETGDSSSGATNDAGNSDGAEGSENVEGGEGGEGEGQEGAELTPEAVRQLVLDLLVEVGLVRRKEPGGGAGEGEMGMAEEVADLRKRIAEIGRSIEEQNASPLQKQAAPKEQAADEARLADLSGSLAKVGGGLGKLAGDLAKAALAVDALGERLDALEKRFSEAGPVRPVLREIDLSGGATVTEEVLKALMGQTDDPMEKQLFGRKLAEMQIKAVQGLGGRKI